LNRLDIKRDLPISKVFDDAVFQAQSRSAMMEGRYAGDITPTQAWGILSADSQAVLVDVRTPAEWAYVGLPDLSSVGKQPLLVPWALFPTMEINPKFGAEVETVVADRNVPLVFLCRSGARSRSAAIAMTARGYKTCYNVDSGFEGEPDANRHRGTVSGWKVEELPWVQG
jgi:rhodanese-related sulfurtransferase